MSVNIISIHDNLVLLKVLGLRANGMVQGTNGAQFRFVFSSIANKLEKEKQKTEAVSLRMLNLSQVEGSERKSYCSAYGCEYNLYQPYFIINTAHFFI